MSIMSEISDCSVCQASTTSSEGGAEHEENAGELAEIADDVGMDGESFKIHHAQ
jgi:hypothetical protein